MREAVRGSVRDRDRGGGAGGGGRGARAVVRRGMSNIKSKIDRLG